MTVRTSVHAMYNIQYHFVWIPKYRRMILEDEIQKETKAIIHGIGERYDFEILEMSVKRDHIHLFLSAPPWYSPAEIVKTLKGVSAKHLFRRFPSIKEKLWGGNLWSRGYFVGTSGDKITNDLVRKYIQRQREQEDHTKQLELF